MTRLSHRSALLAALVAGASGGMGGARVIHREPSLPDPEPREFRVKRLEPGRRSNEPRKLSAKAKKRRNAKIARSSRRYNLRA